MTYLITFSGYACHLHGNEAGSVDWAHDVFGSRLVEADTKRFPRSVGEWRGWTLLAVHVRTNHVHIVVEGDERFERIMNDLNRRRVAA